jgi:hypothetical protein
MRRNRTILICTAAILVVRCLWAIQAELLGGGVRFDRFSLYWSWSPQLVFQMISERKRRRAAQGAIRRPDFFPAIPLHLRELAVKNFAPLASGGVGNGLLLGLLSPQGERQPTRSRNRPPLSDHRIDPAQFDYREEAGIQDCGLNSQPTLSA